MSSKLDPVYRFVDDYHGYEVLGLIVSGLLLGTATLIVLDSAEETPNINISDVQENEDKVCIPPYRNQACYPVNESVNATLENQTSNTTANLSR